MTQSNRSITLHVQKLIYVNIYPEKCFDFVGSLKTCSSARPKTIQVILFLYLKGVSRRALFDRQKQRFAFEFTSSVNARNFIPRYEIRKRRVDIFI